jgi:hypothetical protein
MNRLQSGMIVIGVLGTIAIAHAAPPITEKTSCPDLMQMIDLEGPEAQLPAVIDYNLKNAAVTPLKKRLTPEEITETEAIMHDVMGPLRVLFPDPEKWRQYDDTYIDQHGREKVSQFAAEGIDHFAWFVLGHQIRWADTKYRGKPYISSVNTDKFIESMDPKERREILEGYVTSVLSHVNESQKWWLGKFREFHPRQKITQEQIDTTLARVKQLLKDPHQMELLLDGLDPQFPALAKQYVQAGEKWGWGSHVCDVARVGAIASVCSAAIFGTMVPGGHEAAIIAGSASGVMGALPNLVNFAYNRTRIASQKLLKMTADRAFQRYIDEARSTAARDVDMGWERWTFTSQKLIEEARSAPTSEDWEKAQAFRLINTGQLLRNFSLEELPTGERFEELLSSEEKISPEKIGEILSATDRRLEQLEVVRKEIAQIKSDVLTGVENRDHSAVTNQLTAVQAQAANQLAASTEAAEVHLKNIRNLIQLTGASDNHDKIKAELKAYSDSLTGGV